MASCQLSTRTGPKSQVTHDDEAQGQPLEGIRVDFGIGRIPPDRVEEGVVFPHERRAVHFVPRPATRGQRHAQCKGKDGESAAHSMSRKYSSTRPSAILRPGTPAINHSKWFLEIPLSLSVEMTSFSSGFSSMLRLMSRPSLSPQPKPERPGGVE